jgi:hypothetical protein
MNCRKQDLVRKGIELEIKQNISEIIEVEEVEMV